MVVETIRTPANIGVETTSRGPLGRTGTKLVTDQSPALAAARHALRDHAFRYTENRSPVNSVIANSLIFLKWHGRGREFESHQVHQKFSNTYRIPAGQNVAAGVQPDSKYGRRPSAPRASVVESLRLLGLLSSSRSPNYRLGVNAITLLTILTVSELPALPFGDCAKLANIRNAVRVPFGISVRLRRNPHWKRIPRSDWTPSVRPRLAGQLPKLTKNFGGRAELAPIGPAYRGLLYAQLKPPCRLMPSL